MPPTLLFLLAGLLGWFGSEPSEGKWKLNPAKSSGTFPSEETVVIRRQNELLVVDVQIVISDPASSKFAIRYEAPRKGGRGRVQDGPYTGVLLKQIGRRAIETTFLVNDTPVRTTKAVVAKDGKSMISTGRGLGAGDQPAWVMVFERQ